MPVISTNIPNFSLRFATKRDMPVTVRLVKALAKYENRPQDVLLTEQTLADAILKRKTAEVLLAEYEGGIMGYALFYPVFSSFAGVTSLYLEDLYIDHALHGHGYGKETMRQLAKLAKARGWGQLCWGCLANNQLSIDFYKKLGATEQTSHRHFVLQGAALDALTK